MQMYRRHTAKWGSQPEDRILVLKFVKVEVKDLQKWDNFFSQNPICRHYFEM